MKDINSLINKIQDQDSRNVRGGSGTTKKVLEKIVENLEQLNEAGFITKDVDDLENYNTKTQEAEIYATKQQLGGYYTKEQTDAMLATLGNGSYVVAWDGSSEPVVANIPAGVTVTYDGTDYTGTLEASASTKENIYLVGQDMYITSVNDSTYSWLAAGTTELDLSGYASDAELSQLEAKVDGLSTGKYYGYFAQEEDLPEADVDGFAYVGEGPTYTIYNLRGGRWTSSDITVNQSPIGNDEDIDQNEAGKLQFANRVYNAQQPNGMGYKILRKDATFAEQVTDTNTIYEIRYDFNLNNGTVSLPSGCVLKFNGGKITGGTIDGNKSKIISSNVQIFDGSVSISGTWDVNQAVPEWFGAVADGVSDDTSPIQKAVDLFSGVFLYGNYKISSVTIPLYHNVRSFGVITTTGDGFVMLSGTSFIGGRIDVGTGASAFTLGNSTTANFRRISISDVYVTGGEYGIKTTPSGSYYCTYCVFSGLRIYASKHGIVGSIRGSLFYVTIEQCKDNFNISGSLNIISLTGQAGARDEEYPYFAVVSGSFNVVFADVYDVGGNNQKYTIKTTGENYVLGHNTGNAKELTSGEFTLGKKTRHFDCFEISNPYYSASLNNGTINYSLSQYSLFSRDQKTTYSQITKTDPNEETSLVIEFGSVKYPVGIDINCANNYCFDVVEIYDGDTLLQKMDKGAVGFFSFDLSGTTSYTNLKIVCKKTGTGVVRLYGMRFYGRIKNSNNFISGSTAARPVIDGWIPDGTQFFDKTLGKPIWKKGNGWVDATGTAV